MVLGSLESLCNISLYNCCLFLVEITCRSGIHRYPNWSQETKPCSFPLCWFFNRDPYSGFIIFPGNLGSIIIPYILYTLNNQGPGTPFSLLLRILRIFMRFRPSKKLHLHLPPLVSPSLSAHPRKRDHRGSTCKDCPSNKASQSTTLR